MEAIANTSIIEPRDSHLSTCTVVLTVPKLAITTDEDSGKAWGRCLHSGYHNGWLIIGSRNSSAPRAIGKVACPSVENGVTRVPLYFLLVQQPDMPNVWLRGSLDETVINLDARSSRPSLISGQPCGVLGNWPIKFMVGNRKGWQYREMQQVIALANLSLPDDHKIDLRNENCLDPYKLWMPKKSIIDFDIGGVA